MHTHTRTRTYFYRLFVRSARTCHLSCASLTLPPQGQTAGRRDKKGNCRVMQHLLFKIRAAPAGLAMDIKQFFFLCVLLLIPCRGVLIRKNPPTLTHTHTHTHTHKHTHTHTPVYRSPAGCFRWNYFRFKLAPNGEKQQLMPNLPRPHSHGPPLTPDRKPH